MQQRSGTFTVIFAAAIGLTTSISAVPMILLLLSSCTAEGYQPLSRRGVPPTSEAVQDGGSFQDGRRWVTSDYRTPSTLRVMTFNIRHAELSSLSEIAEVIRQEQPDLVGLQEVDLNASRSGDEDQVYRLGQKTGMTCLRRRVQLLSGGGEMCNALLSRFPILGSERVDLVSNEQPRMMLVAEVLIAPDTSISVGVVHMGLKQDDRVKQAQQIVAALGDREHAILVGDVNEEPNHPAAQLLAGSFVDAWSVAGDGPGPTIPVDTPARRIDYVFFAHQWPAPAEARVVQTQTSDHLPVVASIPLPDTWASW
jgi:endonuclease/exonuclease/phosphatase family metal-dependent hydrolase